MHGDARHDYGKAELLVGNTECSVYYTAQTYYEEKKCKCLSCGIRIEYFSIKITVSEVYDADKMVSIHLNEDDMTNLKKILKKREEYKHKFCETCFELSLIE